MPAFPKPQFPYTFNLTTEIKALRKYKDTKEGRQIPKSTPDNLRIATWNIANLGAQDREEIHLKIIAEIISWFDLVAVQEVNDNFTDFYSLKKILGSDFGCMLCDASGNKERMAFLYRKSKVTVLEEVAELAIPPADFKNIKLPGITAKFSGFDRSPFMMSFKVKNFEFCLLNVHLYFGKENDKASMDRRCLETFCVSRWAKLRSQSKYAYTFNVFAMGDFNLPKRSDDDAVHAALVSNGLMLPEHTSKIFSNISNDKAYDQIAFLPGLKTRILSDGIFDFDNAVFADLFQTKTPAQFRSYIKYYISDHRPMWMELDMLGV